MIGTAHVAETGVILYFASNADTMIATKALKDGGIASRMIPRPANVSSAANLCVTIDAAAEQRALAAIGKAKVPVGGILK